MQLDDFPAALRARKRELRPLVTAGRILRQVHRDLYDKEVQHSYTTSYVWMTNQLGHFTLGLLLTFLIIWLVRTI